jgi:hypothetical protein
MIVINITKFWLMVINPTGYYNMYIYIYHCIAILFSGVYYTHSSDGLDVFGNL